MILGYGVVRRGPAGVIYDDAPGNRIRSFCAQKKGQRDSKCNQYYETIWDRHDTRGHIEKLRCPYGLVTTSAIGGNAFPIILNSFWIKSIGDPLIPVEVLEDALVDEREFSNIITAIRGIVEGVRNDELSHFEAALHDTRHLNHDISQYAETLLMHMGYPQDCIWDMQAIQRDVMAKRVLSIFAASRDLAQAILAHEISRDTSQAGRDKSPIQVHKLFYRQTQISSDRMDKAGLSSFMGNSNRSVRLSSAFKLIPKILLDNAAKYANRGSEVKVLFTESPTFFVIECRNSGPIVHDNEIERVFERGARGSNVGSIKGQGLGLWLAKVIVEANGGVINFSIRHRENDYAGRRIGETFVTIKLPNSLLIN